MNLRVLSIGASFVAVAILEEWRPLRKRVERKSRHVGRDLALAALSALASAIVQQKVVTGAARTVQRRRLGLLNRLPLPRPLRIALGVAALDYTLWLWHYANHRLPLLWRFHRVHHVDLDLDSWTGLRFHFGEMAMAGFFRMLQIRLLGPDPAAVTLWQTLLLPSIFFHHSKLDLPWKVEAALSRLIVTPRMHAIHHSAVREETDSNWSSLFSLWDFLHGTYRLDVPQAVITIGVPAYLDPGEVTLGRVLALPLRAVDSDWSRELE
jgi:sterol desaturase/sphingolipid hydroxylase (fatty acid hydroxylase superfamily)